MDGLYKLWIIHREAGVSIFDQTFAELPKNISSDLIGGFLISILSFSQEIADQEIDYIQLKYIRIVYHLAPKYIIAVACVNEINPAEMERLLKQVDIRFNAKYQKIIDGQFSGNITIFQDFGAEVEEVFATRSIALKFLEDRLDTLKEYYGDKYRKIQDLYRRFLGNQIITTNNETSLTTEEGPHLKFHLIETVKKPLQKIGQITKDITKDVKNKIKKAVDKANSEQK